MPTNVGAGTVWNLPNFVGELLTSDMTKTPFISAIGGLNGAQLTLNNEFPTDSQYSQTTESQPDISETDSLTAPTAISNVRNQSKNVTQIYMESVDLSYKKLSNSGRLSGINTAGVANNVMSELQFQIDKKLEKIGRDLEYTSLRGTYELSTIDTEADRSRGMIEACVTNTVAAGGVALTKKLIDSILKEMFDNGAQFNNLVMLMGSTQSQKVSDIYGYAPESRNVGGVDIQQIITPLAGMVGVMPAHRFMPAGTILFADLEDIKLVFQEVPGKGLLFYEKLAKVGASEKGQIYGSIGLNHGAEFLHGTLTGLKETV
jgi:hypothetical protein